MRKIASNKTRRWHALGTTLGITLLMLLPFAGSAGAAPFAYTANTDSNTVSMSDMPTHTFTFGFMQFGKVDRKSISVIPDGKVERKSIS